MQSFIDAAAPFHLVTHLKRIRETKYKWSFLNAFYGEKSLKLVEVHIRMKEICVLP